MPSKRVTLLNVVFIYPKTLKQCFGNGLTGSSVQTHPTPPGELVGCWARQADPLRFANALFDTLAPGLRKPLSVSPIIILLQGHKRGKKWVASVWG